MTNVAKYLPLSAPIKGEGRCRVPKLTNWLPLSGPSTPGRGRVSRGTMLLRKHIGPCEAPTQAQRRRSMLWAFLGLS